MPSDSNPPKKPKTSGAQSGVVQDPWRQWVSPEDPNPDETPEEAKAALARTFKPDASPIEDDIQNERHATISVPQYGGITVDGLAEIQQAVAHLLKFCVDNRNQIEDIFLQYGVVLVQLEPGQLESPFYIQRRDGWTLAIPDALNREAGCVQLIQAFLALNQDPKIRKILKMYQIRPYKM
jgi:hypothetical protein